MQHVHEPVSCEEDDVRQTRHEGRRHPLCPLAACVFGACLPLAALLATSSHAPELEPAAITSAGVKKIPPLAVSRPHVRSLLSAAGVVWRLSGASPRRIIDVVAVVPGVAHEALLAAGVLEGDPLYRFREMEYQWVAQANWTFTATFTLSPDDPCLEQPSRGVDGAARAATSLRLAGVDTVASFTLNGEALGATRSAFVTHELAIRQGLLRAGANVLVVAFTSALHAAAAGAAAYPYPVPHTQYYQVWSEPSHRNFVRKPASDFGSDWGPSFVPTGLVWARSISCMIASDCL